jgi:hypothetical protein
VITNTTASITACKTHLPPKTEIPVAGAMVKPAAIIAVLQKSLDTSAAVADARAVLHAALAERDAADVDRVTVETAIRGWVLQRFGAGSKEAHDFGVQPKKVNTPSAETRARAVKLAEATRAARGTMSKKEKAKIKGTLHVPIAPAAPATPPTEGGATHI